MKIPKDIALWDLQRAVSQLEQLERSELTWEELLELADIFTRVRAWTDKMKMDSHD